MKIAIAGFQHETNSFASSRTDFGAFVEADAWPGLARGEALIDAVRGVNLPIWGAIEAARLDPAIELAPILWCAAEPSGPVTDDAFDRIANEIVEGVARAGVDGVYLDLHGAMITERHQDGEGELLARLKARLGATAPIAISLDLHANLSPRMVERSDAITMFRSYPHLDMAQTGGRAIALLRRLLAGERFATAHRQAPFLIPLQAQRTGCAPCDRLYAALDELDCVSADLAMGFPAGDGFDTGPSVIVHADGRARADAAADALIEALCAAEGAFDATMLEPEEAVRRALALPAGAPVILADVQDNPGAGASSDTTALLRALIDGGADRAALGLLCDREIAAIAHALGPGARFEGALGGKSGIGDPLRGSFAIEAVSDGRFAFEGEVYAGARAEIGPTALLRVLDAPGSIRVAVSSKRCQALDRAVFTHLGLDPANERILVLKSTAHFRADFEPIAQAVWHVAAPGANPCRTETIPYRRLRPGVRRAPRRRES